MNVSYWRVSLHRPFFVAGFHYVLMVFFEILFFSLGLKNGRYRVAKPNCLPLSHYICQKKFANLVLHTRFFEFSANCPTYVRISQTFISSIQPKKALAFASVLIFYSLIYSLIARNALPTTSLCFIPSIAIL